MWTGIIPIFSQINLALSKTSDWLYILKKKEKRKGGKKNQNQKTVLHRIVMFWSRWFIIYSWTRTNLEQIFLLGDAYKSKLPSLEHSNSHELEYVGCYTFLLVSCWMWGWTGTNCSHAKSSFINGLFVFFLFFLLLAKQVCHLKQNHCISRG